MTYISPRTKVFSHLDRVTQWQAGSPAAPVTIEIDLSNRCDLGCSACHFAYTHTRGPWAGTKGRVLPMAHDHAGDLADSSLVRTLLSDAAAIGVKGIVWSGGGEPTLHPQWAELVTFAREIGLQQGMYTHGGLLTRETGALLGNSASWVVVSLDAFTPQGYASYKRVPPARFEAACHGVRYLTGHNAIVGASFLLSHDNWGDAPAMLLLARTLGATYATFRPLIETSPADPAHITADRAWVTEAEPLLLELAHQADVEVDVARFRAYRDWQGHGYQACHGPTLSTTVTPDGRVWVCPNRREFAGSCLGDLRHESFAGIWARHPGRWTVDRDCRAMCRLHPVNETLAAIYAPRSHDAFI